MYLSNIEDFQQMGIKAVNIRTESDSYGLWIYEKLASKAYKLSEVPEQPYEKCTCEFGCRCWVTVAEF